ARRRRLCPLRLGVSQFPRGQGLRGRARRAFRRRRGAAGPVAKISFRILEAQSAKKTREAKAADLRFMQLALTLGRRGQGRTWPNPAVGAVLVKDGVIVGRGWTQPGGRPHGEPEAFKRAGEAARGATLYVTLEPCSHFGKSPPCA